MFGFKNRKNNKKENKCPFCGQILSSLDTKCPACGTDFTSEKDRNLVLEFSKQLEQLDPSSISHYKLVRTIQVGFIKKFEVPKNKDLMRKVMTIILNKIEKLKDDSENEFLVETLLAKSSEINNLAMVLFPDDESFKEKLDRTNKQVEESKKKRAIKGTIILAAVFIVFGVLTALLIIFGE